MIRLENIRYHSILSNIDLHLEKGKIVMLLGENGCGKTTLIKCLLQLIPYDGKVYFQDRLINDLDKRSLAEIFSYVPQIKTLVDHISVLEFVVAGRTRFLPSYQTPSDKDYDIALNALKEFILEHLKERSMFEISCAMLPDRSFKRQISWSWMNLARSWIMKNNIGLWKEFNC